MVDFPLIVKHQPEDQNFPEVCPCLTVGASRPTQFWLTLPSHRRDIKSHRLTSELVAITRNLQLCSLFQDEDTMSQCATHHTPTHEVVKLFTFALPLVVFPKIVDIPCNHLSSLYRQVQQVCKVTRNKF